jgi:hypothetical protein
MRIPVPTFRCPLCSGVVPNEYKAGRPLTCPVCQQQLQPSRWYLNLVFWSAVGLTLIICFLLGLRGFHFFLAFIVLWFPVDFLWMFAYVRLFPPRFEPYSSPTPHNLKHKRDCNCPCHHGGVAIHVEPCCDGMPLALLKSRKES